MRPSKRANLFITEANGMRPKKRSRMEKASKAPREDQFLAVAADSASAAAKNTLSRGSIVCRKEFPSAKAAFKGSPIGSAILLSTPCP